MVDMEWKADFRMWEHTRGKIYEGEGGEFVASSGGCYLEGTFPTYVAALEAINAPSKEPAPWLEKVTPFYRCRNSTSQ